MKTEKFSVCLYNLRILHIKTFISTGFKKDKLWVEI